MLLGPTMNIVLSYAVMSVPLETFRLLMPSREYSPMFTTFAQMFTSVYHCLDTHAVDSGLHQAS